MHSVRPSSTSIIIHRTKDVEKSNHKERCLVHASNADHDLNAYATGRAPIAANRILRDTPTDFANRKQPQVESDSQFCVALSTVYLLRDIEG